MSIHGNYDNWLESVYQEMYEESDRYYDWCELHDADPDTPEAQAAYEDFIDSLFEPPEPDEDDYEPDWWT
jgi:hypothetical protein